jgi:hypothetical protein
MRRRAEYGSSCHSGKCDATKFEQATMDSYNRWRTASTAGFVVGALSTAAGVTLLLTSPKTASRSRIGLRVSPTSAELCGGF